MAPRIYATIGRAPDNDVVLDDPSVSGHHARLSWSGATLVVEDLSSSNGTFVDGRRVRSERMRPGQELRFGQVPLPWSHEGLRALLKAGAGARTLVLPAANKAPSYVCGACGSVGQLPSGALPKSVACSACGATLGTRSRPAGSGTRVLSIVLGVALGAAGIGAAVVWLSSVEPNLVADRNHVLAAVTEKLEPPKLESKVGEEAAARLAKALTLMDPVTRNTAVKIAARTEGPFHVEQVAEIWSAVRTPWKYVNDPEGRDYFATATETIENGYVGDCDDFAITLASMVSAIGGKARVVIMDGPRGGHAYAEACVQGEPKKVASALIKHYKTRWKRYVVGKVPTTIAYRTSEACPIWLNLDWTSNVPGGAYEPEKWAVAVYPDGRSETLAPAPADPSQPSPQTPQDGPVQPASR